MIVRVIHIENGARYDLEVEALPTVGDPFTDSDGRSRTVIRTARVHTNLPGILVKLDDPKEE